MISTDKQVTARLKRIESRLCHGFAKMGIDVTLPVNKERVAIDVDPHQDVIIVDSLSVTLSELFSAVRSSGYSADECVELDVMYGGETVCVLVTSEAFTDDV